MAGNFKISGVLAKTKDFVGDVWGGTKALLNSGSLNNAWDMTKAGATSAVTSGDGSLDAKDVMKANALGPWGIGLNTLAHIGDPSRSNPSQPTTTTEQSSQWAPQQGYYPYSQAMSGTALDSFFQAPAPIGSNFFNTQPSQSLSSYLQTPQYGTVDTSNNNWYTGTGAGSMGPVPPVTAPQPQTQPAPLTPVAPATTISGIMGANKPTPTAPVSRPNSALDMYNAAPVTTRGDLNAIKIGTEVANYLNDPNSRTISHTSIAQRFNPLAGHEAHVRKMDLAKYAGELSPDRALEDAKFNEEMARKMASMSQ
jgi:hypothetical protein